MLTLSRTIRLFVSSTFSDMKAERDVLQREVFPKLRQLCLANGMRFQPIDLRWGVPEEAAQDNRTMRICLRELKRCQESGPKPNFLILLGDRYGWRPLPEVIPAELFERLRERLPAPLPELLEWQVAQPAKSKGWYRRDDNAVPPLYELRPRGDDEGWHETVEQPLLRALEAAASQIGLDPEHYGVDIGTSATEQEIVEGALKVEDARDHAHAFFRSIGGLPQDPWPRDFVDVSDDGARDSVAQARLDDLKTRIEAKIGATNVHRYRVPWHDGGIQPPDLAQFSKEVYAALKDVILQQIAQLTSTSPEAKEEEAHRAFGGERCRGFIGRAESLEQIAACVRGSRLGMLAVVGPSGSGKSALMAEAVRRAREIHGEDAVLARFIGATPDSANLLSLLRNLVAEIRRRFPAPPPNEGEQSKDGEIPVEINPLTSAFHEALARPTADRPLFIFLDALDQLAPGNGALEGHWLPGSLAPHVRLILSAALPTGGTSSLVTGHSSLLPPDPRAAVTATLERRVSEIQQIRLQPLSTADGRTLVTQWLADAGRTVQPEQEEAILKSFAQEGNPLWLRVAIDASQGLASWDSAPHFNPGLPALMRQVLDRLSAEEEHGAVLVERALAGLACARHGLAEDEILDILSADRVVMADFRRRSPNSPKVDSLPVAVWVRLYGDLAFYLAQHQVQGACLLGFYHRGFLEAVTARSLASREACQARHQHLAGWFGKQDWFIAPATGESRAAQGNISDPPNARKASELPWQLYRATDAADPERRQGPVWQPLVDVLCDLLLIEAKVRAGLVFELQEDYRMTLAALPGQQAALAAERERRAQVERWVAGLIAYSLEWSERRDRLAGGETLTQPEPKLPEPVASCRMWTAEEIKREGDRIRRDPTRRDRLSGFADFAKSECYPLIEFGARPGFLVQHACNYAPGGLARDVASRAASQFSIPLLLLRRSANTAWTPRPACLQMLAGHGAGVESVSVTPDGRRAVSGSWDKTLRVWDLESGACLQTLTGQRYRVRSVSVTPDGRRAVSGSDDATLWVWDLESGECLQTLVGHSAWVKGLSMTPDGRRAVSGSWDRTLRVWDLESGDCLQTLAGHRDGVWSVSVTPDGRRAVSGSYDKTLRVWDLESGDCLQTLAGHSDKVTSVSVTPDGRRAVSASSDMTLRVWDLESGDCLQTLAGHGGGVESVSVTPDGRRAVSASSDMTLRVWDLESGDCLQTLAGHNLPVISVSVTPDGRRAVSGSWDEALRVWDLESGECLQTLARHSNVVESVSVTPDGRRAVSASYDKTLRVWDLESGDCLQILAGHSGGVKSVSVTPDGRRAVSGSWDNTLRVWDLESGDCLQTLARLNYAVDSVSVTPDGRRAVSGSEETLRVWDLESGECLRDFTAIRNDIGSVSVTPDGQRAVSGSRKNNTLRVWDLESGECLQSLPGRSDSVESVSVTPDGRRAVSGSRDKTLRVWDLESGQCLRTLKGHSDSVESVSVTPDGWRAVSGSGDNTLRVWDLESGACVGVFVATASVDAVAAFSGILTVGTGTGEVLFVEMRNLPSGPALATDTSDAAYEASLRRGLDLSRREKSPDHEETLAHLAALATHLGRTGKADEARVLRDEHARMAAGKTEK
jgi:WD40 repeat protein